MATGQCRIVPCGGFVAVIALSDRRYYIVRHNLPNLNAVALMCFRGAASISAPRVSQRWLADGCCGREFTSPIVRLNLTTL